VIARFLKVDRRDLFHVEHHVRAYKPAPPNPHEQQLLVQPLDLDGLVRVIVELDGKTERRATFPETRSFVVRSPSRAKSGCSTNVSTAVPWGDRLAAPAIVPALVFASALLMTIRPLTGMALGGPYLTTSISLQPSSGGRWLRTSEPAAGSASSSSAGTIVVKGHRQGRAP